MTISRRAFLEAGAITACAMGLAAPEQQGKLRIGIIGDTKEGGYGHDLHLAWALCDDVEIVALSDPDEEGRLKRAAECGAQRTYADYREMLEKERPDLVTVCPRCTTNHWQYVVAAAASGAHGFIEKPLAARLVEADAMIAAVDAKHLKWAVAFNWRMVPEVQHALRLVRAGIVGQVMELRARGKEDHRSGGEDMVVLGAHLFDLMRAFAGDPRWCQATALAYGHVAVLGDVREATEPLGPIIGDTIQAAFGFDNGVTGSFTSIKNSGKKGGRWGMDIYGAEGVVSIRMEGTPFVPVIRLLRGPSWMPDPANGVNWEPLPEAPATTYTHPAAGRYAPITNDLIAAIRENREPVVSLQNGRASMEMVSAVFASHIAGQRVSLPLENRDVHPLAR